jgi:hypothetical protein
VRSCSWAMWRVYAEHCPAYMRGVASGHFADGTRTEAGTQAVLDKISQAWLVSYMSN